MSFSPDGSRLALTSESELDVDVWGTKAGKRLYSLPDEPGHSLLLVGSRDNRRLAIARDNGNIAIWNRGTVSQILTWLGLNS